MPLWFAALLGLVEGLTEFIPISSTAHLRLVPTLLGRPDPGAAYTAVLQLGALAAVIVYFARDLFVTLPRAIVAEPRSSMGRLPWKLALATLPIVAAGIVFRHAVEHELRSIYVVAGSLIGVGIVLMLADRRAWGTLTADQLGWGAALAIGFAQACALVPGVSRSGATICAGLVVGASRSEAARFSFLLGIPAIAGAGVFEMRSALAELGADAVPSLAVGTAVAAVSGYLSIAWLLRFLSTHRLRSFAVYRIVLGCALLALLASQVISATG